MLTQAKGFGSNNNQSTGFGQNRPAGFGAPAAAATGGGIFGNASNNTTSTGFGGFGNNQAQNTSSPFGSTSANTGGGIFGQNNNNTTNTGFGSAANTSSPFGANNSGTGFGTGGGFGASATPSAFGGGASAQQNNGTAGAPFQPYVDKDGTAGQQQQYMSITCQDAYRNFSFEELRQQDYIQGRKHGNANGQGGAFGASTGFGGFGANTNTATNTSSPFGANNAAGGFGAQPAANAFGNTASASTGGFGASGGLFGQNKPAGAGLFGNNAAATSSQQSGGLFGTSGTTSTGFGNSSTGGGLFGAKPAATGFGSSTTTGFGANNNQPATGGGLFGANTNNTAAPGLFGANNQQQNTSSPFGGGFGQNQPTQNQTQATGGGLFGNSAFGANNNNNNNNNNQAKPGGLFGTPANANTGGGLFGTNNNQQQQQQPAAGGGLFGGLNNNNNQQNQNTGGGLFGAPKPATSSLFGASQPANNTGAGLFGSAQNNNTGGGLFGNAQNNNSGGGLFGNASNQQKPGGLFGNTLGQTNNNTTGGSLFGATAQNNQNSNSQSLFGNTLVGSQQQQQSPQALTTSILSSTPYGNTELFASLATPQQSVGPLATPLSSSQKQRKPAPLAQWKINPAASSRLITPQKRAGGYGFSYSTYGTPGSAYGSPSLYGGLLSGGSSGRLNKSLSTSNLRSTYNGNETVLNPDAFSPSQRSYRAGGSLKKLHINRNLRSDLFGSEDPSLKSSPLKKAVTFDPTQSQGSDGSPTHDGETSSALTRIEERESATPSAEELGFLRSPRKATNGSLAGQSIPEVNIESVKGNELAIVPEDEPEVEKAAPEQQRPLSMFPDQTDKVPGEYWMKPTKAEIAKMSRQQRKSVKDFTVGRENTGQIQFSEVNLDGVDLDRVIGTDITIQTREAVVYPNEITKQPPGKGFNVPSLITLYNAWPRARAGAIPVYERKGKRYEKHIERLQKVANTEFVDYDPSKGTWTFRVDHFSSYQVPDYDEEEPLGLSSSMLSAPPDTPTPLPASSRHSNSGPSPYMQDASIFSQKSSLMGSNVDDTFEFRKSNRLPGAFDDDVFLGGFEDNNGFNNSNLIGGEYTADLTMPEMQMSGSLGSKQAPQDTSFNDYTSDMNSSMFGDAPKHSPSFAASMKPKSILKASQQLPYLGGTPSRMVDAGAGDWADQLQRTLSPKKRDRNILRESLHPGVEQDGRLLGSLTKESNPFATSIDVMKSLFGGNESKSMQTAVGKGFQV